MNKQPEAQKARRQSIWDFLVTKDQEIAELGRRPSFNPQTPAKLSKTNIKSFEKVVHEIAQQGLSVNDEASSDTKKKKNKKSKLNVCKLPNLILGESIQRKGLIGKGHFGVVAKGVMLAIPPVKKEKSAMTPPLVRKKGIESPGITRKKKSETIVAVKEIISKPNMTADDIKAFFLEGIITFQFKHENVIKCYGMTPLPLGIVLEYCPLGDLQRNLRKLKLIKSYYLPVPDCMEVCYQVCKGMAYLASQDFVHGDLAARNILIASDYTCKVSDLGLSKKNGTTFSLIGEKVPLPTKWCSTELLMDNAFSEKSDTWAWGVLNLEVFDGGTPPYEEKNRAEVILHIATGGGPEKKERCPDDYWKTVLEPCFKALPEDRPSFSQILDILTAKQEGRRASVGKVSLGAAKLFLDEIEMDDSEMGDTAEYDYDDYASSKLDKAKAIVYDCDCDREDGLCTGNCKGGLETQNDTDQNVRDSIQRPDTPSKDDQPKINFFPKQSLYRKKGNNGSGVLRQKSDLSHAYTADGSGNGDGPNPTPSVNSDPKPPPSSVHEDAASVTNSTSTNKMGKVSISTEQLGIIEFVWVMALAPARSGVSGMDKIGCTFMDHLFRLSPRTLEAFGSHAKDDAFRKLHALKFLKTTSHAISLLSKPQKFREYLLNLGERHVGRVDSADFFVAAGQAMTEAIYSELNDQFTMEAQEAFNMFLQVFVNLMHQGWRKALKKQGKTPQIEKR
eukprot:m.58104 g.58104  ORF g.58104 m.58104 type:complete len:730 (+) comp11156_c0_seq1:127-2316(+)